MYKAAGQYKRPYTWMEQVRNGNSVSWSESGTLWGTLESGKYIKLRGLPAVAINDRLVDLVTGTNWKVTDLQRDEDEISCHVSRMS